MNIPTIPFPRSPRTGVDNPMLSVAMELNPWVTFVIVVLIAPTAEELLFRKLLTERIVKYGELPAVLASGLFSDCSMEI